MRRDAKNALLALCRSDVTKKRSCSFTCKWKIFFNTKKAARFNNNVNDAMDHIPYALRNCSSEMPNKIAIRDTAQIMMQIVLSTYLLEADITLNHRIFIILLKCVWIKQIHYFDCMPTEIVLSRRSAEQNRHSDTSRTI